MRLNRGKKPNGSEDNTRLAALPLPKMIRDLPEPSKEILCRKFDGRISLSASIIAQELRNDRRAAEFFRGTDAIQHNKLKLVHASSGEYVFTMDAFINTIAQLNAA